MPSVPDLSKYNDSSVFPNILVLFEYLKARGWVGLAHSGPCFECMQLYGDRLAAAPMPMNPLYRGESEFHPVCKPNIFRKDWTEAERLEMEIQMADFRRMLECHPQIQDLKEGGLYVNYSGLAQHYGLKTNVLDLTNSPLVAAFFATTEYDGVADAYRPILDSSSEGVLYFFPLGGMFDFDEKSPRIWPIGQEALRRPGEQRGYGIEMMEGDDLNTYPGKILFRFKHSREASIAIWNASHGGTIFFPYDPMAEKVRAMMKYRIYSKDSLREIYNQHCAGVGSIAEIQNVLEAAGCTFVDKVPFAYTAREIEYLNEEFR